MELQEGSWGKEREVDKGVKTSWSVTIFLGFKEVSERIGLHLVCNCGQAKQSYSKNKILKQNY